MTAKAPSKAPSKRGRPSKVDDDTEVTVTLTVEPEALDMLLDGLAELWVEWWRDGRLDDNDTD